jgi:hypothetical protein
MENGRPGRLQRARRPCSIMLIQINSTFTRW